MSAISTQLAHGIKATTTTAGTGSVTLAALTGFMLPLARFSVGSLMSYSIQDGNNREWGIGTVQAGGVLDRTTITGTLVAGTYTTGGTALTLSGGQCLVECVEHEGSDLNGVTEFYSLKAGFPTTGKANKLYVDLSTGYVWRWDATNTVYVGAPFAIDSSGNLIANVNHRTDTLTNLLAEAGGLGEISFATDVDALVLHNGVAGQAVPFVRSSKIGEVWGISTGTTLTGGSTTTLFDFTSEVLKTGVASIDLATNMLTINPLTSYLQVAGYIDVGTDADITVGTYFTVILEYEIIVGVVWGELGRKSQALVATGAGRNIIEFDFGTLSDFSGIFSDGLHKVRVRVEHNDGTDVYSGITGQVRFNLYGAN